MQVMPRIRATHPVSQQLLKVPPREAWAQRMAVGSGSTPMPGPLQVQHLPLQTNPSGLRGHRDVRSTLKTAQLSPSQQAFVDSLQGRFRREQAAERQLADGTGEAGDPALSAAPCIGERSTEGERQTPDYLPTAVSKLAAVHAGRIAATRRRRVIRDRLSLPSRPGRCSLRTETERRWGVLSLIHI